MDPMIFQGSYTKSETYNLLTNKVSNIGNVPLPGHLDIGTYPYTSSRIRCNVEVNGYVGYAELNGASSYDMFINLSTTRTDGGWMYCIIDNDSYMQLSGSDNDVNIYKGTTISSTLTINGNLGSSMKYPSLINGSTIHTDVWTFASFRKGIASSGSWLQFSRYGTSNTWQTGMSSDNSYVIRASGATNVLNVGPNGNVALTGDLEVGSGASVTPIKAHVNHEGSTGFIEIEARWRNQACSSFDTAFGNGYIFFEAKNEYYMYCVNNFVNFFRNHI